MLFIIYLLYLEEQLVKVQLAQKDHFNIQLIKKKRIKKFSEINEECVKITINKKLYKKKKTFPLSFDFNKLE